MNLEEHVDKILENPHESLAIELKDWLDPDISSGKAKIVKTTIAMRNNDGGIMIIGVKNDGQLNLKDAPNNVEEFFNIDKIQGLITKHSSESFEITILYREKQNKKFVAIITPPGIKTPVAIKKAIIDESGKNIIEQDAIFVRSLDANGTPSSTKANYKDWPKIVEKCFDNREADIGKFLRRHLANVSNIKDFFNFFLEEARPKEEPIEDQMLQFLDDSLQRYSDSVKERGVNIPPHGAMEVGAIIKGESKKFSTNNEFLNLLLSGNPDYTGWPIWVDTRNFSDITARPQVFKSYWESLIAHFDVNWADSLDFWRLSPVGRFYLRRALQDDVSGSEVQKTYLKSLDFGLVVLRVAEAIAVAIAFAKTMEYKEGSSIFFAFRWSALKNRILSSWANPSRHLSYERKCIQNDTTSYIDVPMDVPKSVLFQYVHQVNKPLFELFEGFELPESVTEDLVARLLERRL